jgi:hypothetical protein
MSSNYDFPARDDSTIQGKKLQDEELKKKKATHKTNIIRECRSYYN